MTTPELPNDRSRQEWLAVAVVSLIGAILRFLPIGRLGLTHFDEGIYALAASWSLHPRGIASLSPELISYAPPGYPILGGLAYAVLGRSDTAMILVSQIAGALTIPVVAWLARRTFGPGSGFAAAVFCAFSGSHIAFSRMALTDASSLLAWFLAIGAGMRFLERPGFVRALLMGLAVGLAQEFKYNGWLSGGIVIGTAFVGIVARPEERKIVSIVSTFAWGGFAAGIAWLVVWPCYAFVEAHGGYSALLRHQQSYLGGFRAWWPNFLIQADQAVALSGGLGLILPTILLVGLTPWISRSEAWSRVGQALSVRRGFGLAVSFGFVGWFFIDSPYRLGLMAFPWLLTRRSSGSRMIGVWWLLLAAISPFYHPYARLWLPFHASNWLLMGWVVADVIPSLFFAAAKFRETSNPGILRLTAYSVVTLSLLGGIIDFLSKQHRKATPQSDLLAPSDSLREATNQIAAILPDDVKELQLLARPPVRYYLAGRLALSGMQGSDQLLKPGSPQVWVVVDSAILRSELGQGSEASSRNLLDRFANHWEVVQEIPTTLALPTLLDLDPGAARSASADRTCRLWLLRPRRRGAD